MYISGGAQHQIKRGQFLLLQRAMADLLALDSFSLFGRPYRIVDYLLLAGLM